MSRVYLDGNAALPLRPEAERAMRDLLDERPANPSSVHAEGRRARSLIESARRDVAALIGAKPHEIIFTSSGTEACQTAIFGYLSAAHESGRGGSLFLPTTEHDAVRQAVTGSKIDTGIHGVEPSGLVDLASFFHWADHPVALVAFQWANNETGVIHPIEEIARACVIRRVALFVDASQAAGRLPIHVGLLPITMLALSSAKIGGPSGVGALYVREGTRLEPRSPGHQERGWRGGTENVAGIVGFGAAARAAAASRDEEMERLLPLRDELIRGVLDRIPGAILAGADAPRLANTAQFVVDHGDEEMLILALDRAGYAVSAGAACAAGAHERSHVLQAMGLLGPGKASVRVSLTYETTHEEIEGFINAFAEIMAAERAESHS